MILQTILHLDRKIVYPENCMKFSKFTVIFMSNIKQTKNKHVTTRRYINADAIPTFKLGHRNTTINAHQYMRLI